MVFVPIFQSKFQYICLCKGPFTIDVNQILAKIDHHHPPPCQLQQIIVRPPPPPIVDVKILTFTTLL